MTLAQHDVREAGHRLIPAADRRQQCGPVRDTLGDNDVDAAYAVQLLITEDSLRRGRPSSATRSD